MHACIVQAHEELISAAQAADFEDVLLRLHVGLRQ